MKSRSVAQIIQNLPLYPGYSFLLNYGDLAINYRSHSQDDVKNYIVLASYRDYNACRLYDDYTLDWDMTAMSIAQIDMNKLLWHKDRRIFFRFEETKASTLRKRNKNGN